MKDAHVIRLTWALPPVVEHYHSKPDECAAAASLCAVRMRIVVLL